LIILNWMITEPAITDVITTRLASIPRSAAKAATTAWRAVPSKSCRLPETVRATSTVPSFAVAVVPDWMVCCVPVALVTLVATIFATEFAACWVVTGLPVGERLGRDVLGGCVGVFVGVPVTGELDGVLVVGASVGGEGEAVGDFVGVEVAGACVGGEGDSVGPLVGGSVGALVTGELVGEFVGLDVLGPRVGESVGIAGVGESVA